MGGGGGEGEKSAITDPHEEGSKHPEKTRILIKPQVSPALRFDVGRDDKETWRLLLLPWRRRGGDT